MQKPNVTNNNIKKKVAVPEKRQFSPKNAIGSAIKPKNPNPNPASKTVTKKLQVTSNKKNSFGIKGKYLISLLMLFTLGTAGVVVSILMLILNI